MELLIVIAIAAITTTWAIPGYQGLVARYQVAAETVRIKNALALARTTAVTSRTTITLCPVATPDARHCDFSDWAQRIAIVKGNVNGGDLSNARLLRIMEGGLGPTTTFNRQLPIRYQATGWSQGHNGTFDICGRHGHGAGIIVSNMGRVRVSAATPSTC